MQQQIDPAPAPRGTLLPPQKPLEVKLERTPEQEAANEAVAKLVRQCLAGDALAWQQLVVSQNRRIYAICYRFTGSCTDAEDLTQDVFLKLYKNLASFDTQKGSFQTWITTLARNLLVDHFRRTRLAGAARRRHRTQSQGPERPQTALPRAPRGRHPPRP
jgi:RNA polymerase sigma-70 factor (ECF subfamily)